MEEDQVEQEDFEEEETPEEEKKPSPALTITIPSWWTPIVGGILLVVGLLAGYFLRPMITPDALADAGGSSSAPAPTTAPQPTVDPESRKQLMDFLLPQVKHFKGDANAPVTLIEFSERASLGAAMWQRRLVIASLAVALTCISAACKKRVLDLDYAITAFRAGDHATGIAVAQRLAENGDPNARSPLASKCYQHGLLLDQPGALPEELEEAAYWVGEGARLGLPEAQYRYAEMLLAGDGVEKQPQEAKAFLLQAAQAGLTEAQVRLAVMLRNGLGVGWGPGQAVKWLPSCRERRPLLTGEPARHVRGGQGRS